MRQSRAPHDFREACNEVSAATRYGPHTTDAASGGAPPLASLQKPVNAPKFDTAREGSDHSSPAGASQGQVKRSTSDTAPKSRMAITESRIIELKASSVFQYDVADRIT